VECECRGVPRRSNPGEKVVGASTGSPRSAAMPLNSRPHRWRLHEGSDGDSSRGPSRSSGALRHFGARGRAGQKGRFEAALQRLEADAALAGANIRERPIVCAHAGVHDRRSLGCLACARCSASIARRNGRRLGPRPTCRGGPIIAALCRARVRCGLAPSRPGGSTILVGQKTRPRTAITNGAEQISRS